MAERIQLSEGQAQSAVGDLNSKKETVLNSVMHLQKAVDKVGDWWIGDSSQAFIQEFTQVRNLIEKNITECIDKYTTLLLSAIKAHQDADREIAQKIRS